MDGQVLADCRSLVDASVTALARRCISGGTVDLVRLDQYQVSAYEAAFASAELLAAESVFESLSCDASALDRHLARLCIVDSARSIVQRVQTIRAQLRMDAEHTPRVPKCEAIAALLADVTDLGQVALAGQALTSDHFESMDIGPVSLDDSARLAQESFRRFASDEVAPLAERIHRLDETVPQSLIRSLADMGAFGLSIPETYGGSQLGGERSSELMLVVTEALSEASLAAAGSLITRPEILARVLLTGGTEEQRRRWLPALSAGNPLCAIAITEPDAGSDVAALSLKATSVPAGWILNGAKTWCTLAGMAGVLMVVARTNPDRALGYKGLSVFLVEKPSVAGHAFEFKQPAGGTLSGRSIATIGYRGMHSFDLTFDEVFVPDSAVVGGAAGLGQGFVYTMAGMTGGRLQTAARALGVMRAALRAAIRHARNRRVFGSPLAAHQLTQAKLLKMAAQLAASRQLTFAVARKVDAGFGRIESSLAKLLACRNAESVTRDSMQIHGGMGYAEEAAVSRYFVDARVLSIFEGAEETLALKVIARGLVEDVLRRQES